MVSMAPESADTVLSGKRKRGSGKAEPTVEAEQSGDSDNEEDDEEEETETVISPHIHYTFIALSHIFHPMPAATRQKT